VVLVLADCKASEWCSLTFTEKYWNIGMCLSVAVIPVMLHVQVSSVTKMGDGDKVSVVTNTGVINDVDCLLWAIGRTPNIGSLHLDRVVSVP